MSASFACLYGFPITNSQSPALHHSWFQTYNVNANYLLCETAEKKDFQKSLDNFLLEKNFLGANFTTPFKEVVGELFAFQQSPTVKKIGAANVLYRNHTGDWTLGNTDVLGVEAAFGALELPQESFHVCILGGGGAALAALEALENYAQCFSLSVHVRTPEERESKVKNRFPQLNIKWLPLSSLLESKLPTVLINSLPVQVRKSCPNLAAHITQQNIKYYFDMAYLATPELTLAKNRGIKVEDGVLMLKTQAAASFEFWTGIHPNFT